METEAVKKCDICGCTELSPICPELSLCRCAGCGFVFRNPRPSAAEISAYYSGETQYDAW
jgi:hypothetical protein